MKRIETESATHGWVVCFARRCTRLSVREVRNRATSRLRAVCKTRETGQDESYPGASGDTGHRPKGTQDLQGARVSSDKRRAERGCHKI